MVRHSKGNASKIPIILLLKNFWTLKCSKLANTCRTIKLFRLKSFGALKFVGQTGRFKGHKTLQIEEF